MFDLWVKFSYALLILSKVIKGAVMGLGMSVLWAENKATLARNLQHPYFFGAMPALVFVSLKEIKEIG